MALRTLSELVSEAEENPHLKDQVYLAMELGRFRERVAKAIMEVSLANMGEALETLEEINPDPAVLERCRGCDVFTGMVKDACDTYLMYGAAAAKEALESARSEHLITSLDRRGLCPDLFIDISNEAMQLFELVQRISEGFEPRGNQIEEKWRSIDPERCAQTIFSLSNPHRLNLMMLLSGEETSFSELSNRTGLRTGHLQFHLRSLMSQGLVEKEERGIYRLNSRGQSALNYLAEFQSFMHREDDRESMMHRGGAQ